MQQYRWLEIRLEDLDSYGHPTVYCNYDYNRILANFKNITIDDIFTPSSVSTLVYDKAEPLDMQDLYLQYLARLHDFKYSRKTKADYGNSPLLAEDSEGLADQDTFLTKYNVPLWIDLSATRSYAKKQDPPNAVVTPQIKIIFKAAVTKSYMLRVNAYFPSQYNLTSIGSGQTSSRVVSFLPMISTNAQ